MSTILVKTASSDYPVVVQPRLLEKLAGHVCKACGEQRAIFVVTSPEIWSRWGHTFLSSFADRKIDILPLFIPPGERYKQLKTVEHLAEKMIVAGAKRDALLMAFGGGVIGDMTGFLAAIYMRGIRYVQVPTTYLSQIDSSLGGKTGVNLRVGKNLLGSFHPPVAVFSDPAVLSTLPPAELRSGAVESVKAAVLGDADYFDWLEHNLDSLLAGETETLTRAIETSVRIKAEIVSLDERESGERMLLNLGHTVGHAIEAATRYRGLLHGEAVAWGMIASLHLAVARSALTLEQATRIEELTFRLGPFPRFRATSKVLLERTAGDKKHLQSARRFVLPVAIGKAIVVEDVSQQELLAAIQSMLRTMKERGV
ncbi:MAG TPA: 3-dehydroquinate synthase [Acidobacteriaceae bacterium]|nr:3-dehydroquinate synthase [Terriglobia bacterium]HVC89411.1 3-dehydroquinate synthase [Acidobacteriaceae bacterium]